MNSIIQELRQNLMNELERVDPGESPVKGFDKTVRIIRRFIGDLKINLRNYEFQSVQEEIDYYRNDAVFFYQLYFEHVKQYGLAVARITLTKPGFDQFIANDIAEMEAFHRKHHGLVLYFYSGERDLDDSIFVWNRPGMGGLATLEIILDESLCIGSYLLAWSNCYKKYKVILQQAAAGEFQSETGDIYEWACSDADASEVMKALYKKGAIKVNGKEANIKQLSEFWKIYLRRPVKNVYDRMRINQKRKKDDTPFLNSLISVMKEGKGT